MKRLLFLLVLVTNFSFAAVAPVEVLPGVWRISLGQPEAITPVSVRHFAAATDGLAALPRVGELPIAVRGEQTARGFLVSVPLAPDELIYGLGLQLMSFQQRGLKKKLRVNADPAMDTGDSHAPVPFYVTTRGYGVFIDTARYATFYLGNKTRRPERAPETIVDDGRNDGWNGVPPYERSGLREASEVLVEIPQAAGVDVYVFAGPSLRAAVQRYNLFSGGGPVLPRWGLGFWYRVQTDFAQAEVLKLAAEFRERRIPCDVLGLEPHWQSHSYSSSYVWGSRFPDPAEMLAQLQRQHFRLNLWEQAFVHPSSPIYAPLVPHAGDYEVWDGLVPDFLVPEARRIFADFHERTHVLLGVSGYKADECDNSDLTGNWSFPEIARFPSGADGEQMHALFGLRYQDAILSIFEKRAQRTLGLVRSSGPLAAPYPFALYSDLYQHSQFVHGIAQASFSGLLWTPEVRDARTPEELIRRLQSVVFSPLAMINAWYLRNPPWKQTNRAMNNAGQFADGWEQVESQCRELVELRMKFIPYLHAAFVRYQREGLPPFRALVMDFPDDPAVHNLSDEFLMGDDLLVAPVIVPPAADRGSAPTNVPTATASSPRSIYLPEGEWFDFWTGERHAGKQRITIQVPLGRIPVFVKAGSIIALAHATLHTDDPESRKLSVLVFGDGSRGATLYEDDGKFVPTFTAVRLEWDAARRAGRLVPAAAPAAPGEASYSVSEWKVLP